LTKKEYHRVPSRINQTACDAIRIRVAERRPRDAISVGGPRTRREPISDREA